MTFVYNLINNARTFVWKQLSAISEQDMKPEEFLKRNLLAFADGEINRRDCFENIAECLEVALQYEDCSLFDSSKTKINDFLILFDSIINKVNRFSENEILELRQGFKKVLAKQVVEKWVFALAVEFHPIASLSENIDKAVAAEKWTNRFFQGVDYFCSLQEMPLSQEYFAHLCRKTISALEAYAEEVSKNKLKSALNNSDKNSFFSSGEKIISRGINPFTFLGKANPYPLKQLLRNCINAGALSRQHQFVDSQKKELFMRLFENPKPKL